MDLRQRILDCYDNGDGSRQEVAERFRVSLGMVKKLLSQRRRRKEIGPQHYRSGRKARLVGAHRRGLRQLVKARPDITLAEMREELNLDCTLQAIHYVLAAMDLTYKKRRCGPANRIAATSSRRADAGVVSKAALIRTGSSSSTSRRPKRT